MRPFLIVAQKTEYRDISGQFFFKSHLIVTKTRNIMEKIFRDRFCHGISASKHSSLKINFINHFNYQHKHDRIEWLK